MATASSLLCEEQLSCSICLGGFTEPVSTPCGHNYCKACITGYWARSDVPQCPLCKKKFRSRPKLQVNTEFRDMVEHFNSMMVRSEDEAAKPGEVPCDVCHGPKLKAQKTCLACLTSYCQSHLEPHQRVAGLKKHKLIDPVSDLEDRVCKKHDKMFEFFCRWDEVCVCFMCLKDDHVMHETVPLEHVFREKKDHLESTTSGMKMVEDIAARNIAEIKCSIKESKKESEKEIADIDEVFAALVASLQKSRAKLTELVQENQREATREAEDLVVQLEQEMDKSRDRRSKVEQLLQTEDHLGLLQSWSSIDFFALDEDLSFPTLDSLDLFYSSPRNYVEALKKAVAQMEKILSDEILKLARRVRSPDGYESDEQPGAAEKLMMDEFVKDVWCAPQDRLMMIQQCDAMDVTLDAYSASPRLKVSLDGTQVSSNDGQLIGNTLFRRRFEYQPFVLATDGFSSGRFYYEVRVSGSTSWLLGVVKESFNKLTAWYPTPEDGGWTFGAYFSNFQQKYYNNFYSSPISLMQTPQTVGVFVDYEKGEVTFYDVDARTVIYSYTECSFTESAAPLKALLYTLTGMPLSNRPKLYPIFGIMGDEPYSTLKIVPVGGAI